MSLASHTHHKVRLFRIQPDVDDRFSTQVTHSRTQISSPGQNKVGCQDYVGISNKVFIVAFFLESGQQSAAISTHHPYLKYYIEGIEYH